MTDSLTQFREMAAAAGRPLDAVPVTVFGVSEDPDRLKLYRDRGIARAVVSLPSAKADEISPALDRRAEFALLLKGQAALRSSSSIWTFCGPRRKAMRTPGRIVFGSTVNSAPFCLSSATTASIPSTRSPRCSSPR